MFLLFLVVCGVIALVVVKVVKPNQAAIQSAAAAVTPASVSNFTNTATGAVQNVINQVTRHRRALRLLDPGEQVAMLSTTGQQQQVVLPTYQPPAAKQQVQEQRPQDLEPDHDCTHSRQRHHHHQQHQQHRQGVHQWWESPWSLLMG